jgi:hypothetical protein
VFQGGTATISWTYLSYPTHSATFCIDGQNPGSSTVTAAIAAKSTFWAMPTVVKQESSLRQFEANSGKPTLVGEPIANSYNNYWGYGMTQLTNPAPNSSDMWNWLQNLADGITLFNTYITKSQTDYNNEVTNYNQTLCGVTSPSPTACPNKGPIPEPAVTVEALCTFSFYANLNTASGQTHSFADAIALKRWNSATEDYLKWYPAPTKTWIINKYALNGTDYVNSVCQLGN